MKLADVICSHCEAAGLEPQAEGAVCRYCGTANALTGVLCPRCDEVNPRGAEVCADCRQGLARTCPDCGLRQWAGVERCGQCGRALDALALSSGRWGRDPANRLNEQARSVAALKAHELADGERRSAEFAAIEARRQALLAEARHRRDAQQRIILMVLGGLTVGFIIFVGVLVVAAALGD
ncbi:MAG: hypothetical protein IT317_12125 [Anaerolineales bacterium]|nr:hypothetical protein [Anaerolineales bacterium]